MSADVKNPKRRASPRPAGGARPMMFQASFDDLDHFIDATRAWDLDFRRVDATPFRGRITQLNLGDLRYDSARLSAPLEQAGSPPRGMWTFAVPVEPDPRMIWRRREIRPAQLPVYHPGSEIDAVSRPGFDVVPVAFSPETLERHARELDLPRLAWSLERADVFAVDARRLGAVARRIGALLDAVASDPGLLDHPATRRTLHERIPRALLRTVAGAEPAPPGAGRASCVDECVSVIEASRPPLTVAKLAAIVGVTERAVQFAFVRRFGVTPKAYLKARQLNDARARLRAASGAARVSDIANACGFWHMGQFAADYRRMFGERPSDTRARAPGAPRASRSA